MAVFTARYLINAPLDYLNALDEPAFDYFVTDPEQSVGTVMPKPLAFKFVTIVGHASRGVAAGTFDGFSEPNANPDDGTCHRIKVARAHCDVTAGKRRSRSGGYRAACPECVCYVPWLPALSVGRLDV